MKVRFNNDITIHYMFVWKFAYSEARKGKWDSVVADRYRFKRKCIDVEKSISYIFDHTHRKNMYKLINKSCNVDDDVKKDINENGFYIFYDVLLKDEIIEAKKMFYIWKDSLPKDTPTQPFGIYRYHEAGHQEHAWYIRTRPKVQDIFKRLLNTNKLIVSFDGCCHNQSETNFYPKQRQELQCYQGFVPLTDNIVTLVVVKKKKYKFFKDKYDRIPLKLPAGCIVVWDSIVFHQNVTESEESIIQYICYLPKNHKKNTKAQRAKRVRCFNERRTTSYSPCPIKVNPLQPNLIKKKIDYSALRTPDLDRFMDDIMELI